MRLANPWVWVGFSAAVVGAFLGGVYMEHGRFMGFVAKVEVLGEQAAKEAGRKAAENKQLRKMMEEQHEQNQKAASGALVSLARQLRDARTRGRVVPAASTTTTSSSEHQDGRACFSREDLHKRIDGSLAKYEGRMAGLEQRLVQLVQRGAGALVNLNTCAGWVQAVVARASTNDLTLKLSMQLSTGGELHAEGI